MGALCLAGIHGHEEALNIGQRYFELALVAHEPGARGFDDLNEATAAFRVELGVRNERKSHL